MKIGIGNDHVAVEYKKEIKKYIKYVKKHRNPPYAILQNTYLRGHRSL